MNTINNLLETVIAAKNAYENVKAQIQQSHIRPLFDQVFADCPELNSFGWGQYTPYFNDGDECVFTVHNYSDDIKYNGDFYYDLEEDVGEMLRNGPGKQIEVILRNLGDDILRDLFGDHAEITIHRDGSIEVNEYQHD